MKRQKMKNRWFSLLLVYVMVMSLLPVYDSIAAEGDPSVDMGNPKYVTNSTTEICFSDVTISTNENIKSVIVSVDAGVIKVDNASLAYTMSDRADDGNHKTYAWVNETGWDVTTIRDLLESLTFTYVEGMHVNVTIDSNEVKGNYNSDMNITSNNIHEANGHYYMYVPYDVNEKEYGIDDSVLADASDNAGYSTPTWTQAYNKSKDFTFMGMKGYLATITSTDESALLHSINDKAGWCGGTMVRYADGTKFNDQDEIVGALISPDGPVSGSANAATNREYYYWACGPEAGIVINDAGLWDDNEPNYNANPNNPALSTETLGAEHQLENCVIANYKMSVKLNDIKEGNYKDPDAGIDYNGNGTIETLAGRAFGYFVEFGGYTTEYDTTKVNKAFQSKEIIRLSVDTQASNGAFNVNVVDSVWPGEEVKATVTPDTGYKLPESITVTVGGTTLTENQYTWDPTTGEVVITAANVTGDVVIDVDCIPETVNAKVSVENGSATQNNTIVEEDVDKTINTDNDYTVTIKPDDDYKLPVDVTVTVGGQQLEEGTDYSYNKTTGEVTIDSDKLTGDVVIEAVCVPETVNATVTVGNGTAIKNGAVIEENKAQTINKTDDYTVTIQPEAGYKLPESIIITVDGQPLDTSKYTYDSTTGVVTIDSSEITGNVVIDADCIPQNVNAKVSVENGSATQNNTIVEEDVDKTINTGNDYTVTIKPDDDYKLPADITVMVGGQQLEEGTDYSYNKTTGEVTIDSDKLTGDVVIEAVCVPETVNATVTVGNGTAIKNGAVIEENKAQTINKTDDYTVTIKPADGYKLPESITITVDGQPLDTSKYSYDSTTGKVTIASGEITGDIVINADCVQEPTAEKVTAKVTVGNGTAEQNNTVVEEETAKEIDETQDYTVTIKPTDGYKLPESITITVDGQPLDTSKYSYDSTTGKVTIDSSAITGDVVIDADCVKATDDKKDAYTATGKVTNGSFDGSATATPGKDYTATIEANDGYELPEEITVTVGGKEIDSSDYEWNPETGEVTIPGASVTGDVVITAECEEETFDVEDDITNGTFDGSDTAKPGEDYTATITPDDGYDLPEEITVTVDGEELDSDDYTWDSETGEITIDGDKVTGDVEISATCVKIVTKGNPSTGDSSNVMLYFMIMILALAGVTGCTIYKVRER